MTTKDIVLLLLGAAAGVVASVFYDYTFEHLRVRIIAANQRRRVAADRSARRSDNALRYFKRIGRESELYVPTHFHPPQRLPVIRETSPQAESTVTPTGEAAIALSALRGLRHEFPVRPRLIRKTLRTGARMFDGTVLYVSHRTVDMGRIKFTLDRCNYYAYATRMALIRQVMNATFPGRFEYSSVLNSLSAGVESPFPPQIAGCSCVSVFTGDGGRNVLLSHRSSEVAHSAGLTCSLPSFGLEANIASGQVSKYGLFFYNYLREFGEEILNLEDLIDLTSSQHFGPDWIFTLPGMPDLEKQVIEGNLTIKCLGVTANAYDGALDFALLAEFSSLKFLEKMKASIVANWESASKNDGSSIELVDLFDPRIDELVRERSIDNCSVVALDCARSYYSKP